MRQRLGSPAGRRQRAAVLELRQSAGRIQLDRRVQRRKRRGHIVLLAKQDSKMNSRSLKLRVCGYGPLELAARLVPISKLDIERSDGVVEVWPRASAFFGGAKERNGFLPFPHRRERSCIGLAEGRVHPRLAGLQRKLIHRLEVRN